MADITITRDELLDPAIDDAVNLQKSARNAGGEHVDKIKTPIYYNPIFYYTLATSLGAVAIWAINEPFHNEKTHEHERNILEVVLGTYLFFGPIAAMMGLSIGAVYGIVNRKWAQAFYCGVVGAGVGMGATIVTTVIAEVIYIISGQMAYGIGSFTVDHDRMRLYGLSFFVQMCGRGIAWSVASVPAGLGLGIALKSKKLVLNGFAGSIIGGLLGGLMFDPILRFLTPNAESAGLSRCLGVLAVGMFVGMFIGIFENLSKEAWFLMLKGPLTGKQFIVFKSPMQIGSSPKSEVYLFKDPDIAPLHASVTKSGSRFVLKDEGSTKGTYVNGNKIDKYVLQNNDTITIGEAVLKYSERARG